VYVNLILDIPQKYKIINYEIENSSHQNSNDGQAEVIHLLATILSSTIEDVIVHILFTISTYI
jgi:hypothetical protein